MSDAPLPRPSPRLSKLPAASVFSALSFGPLENWSIESLADRSRPSLRSFFLGGFSFGSLMPSISTFGTLKSPGLGMAGGLGAFAAGSVFLGSSTLMLLAVSTAVSNSACAAATCSSRSLVRSSGDWRPASRATRASSRIWSRVFWTPTVVSSMVF